MAFTRVLSICTWGAAVERLVEEPLVDRFTRLLGEPFLLEGLRQRRRRAGLNESPEDQASSKMEQTILSKPWTGDSVFERIVEAARTLRQLPPVKGPAGYRSAWPDWVRDAWHKYGREAATVDLGAQTLRIRPSPEAIDRMDETILWLQLLDDEMARVVWARANRVAWWKLSAMMGCDPRTCRRRLLLAMVELASTLNANGAGERTRRYAG